MGIEDGRDGQADEQNPTLGWVDRALVRSDCEEGQKGMVYSIVSRLLAEGVAQRDIVSDLSNLRVEGFIEKHGLAKKPASAPPKAIPTPPRRPSGFSPAAVGGSGPRRAPSMELEAAKASFARVRDILEGTDDGKDNKE